MRGITLTAILYVILITGCIVGWIMNIVSVFHMASDPITGVFVVRCIGIVVFPLGGVLGYL